MIRVQSKSVISGTLSVLLLSASASSAYSQDIVGTILRGLVAGVAISNAKKSWTAVDPDIRTCFVTRYNLNPDDLAQRGIGAQHPRIQSQMNQCSQAVVEQREAAARAEQERLAKEESDRQAAEQVRLAAERQHQVELKRKTELVTKYGNANASAILSGNVLRGMSKEQVIAAKGQPSARDVVPPSDELWRFGAEQIVFTNGKVSYVGR